MASHMPLVLLLCRARTEIKVKKSIGWGVNQAKITLECFVLTGTATLRPIILSIVYAIMNALILLITPLEPTIMSLEMFIIV